MSMHGANGKGKRKQKGHLAFQVPFLHVLARSHENGTNGGLTKRIRYAGYSLEGERIEREAEGFHARVVQHEFDHLEGILYPMRVTDWTNFGYTDALFPEERR